MNKKSSIIIKNIAWQLGALVVIIYLWSVIALFYNKPFILPSPSSVFREAAALFSDNVFWQFFYNSIVRCLLALALSFICALILAILSRLFNPLYKMLAPLVTILRSVPTMSVIFILLLVFSPKTAPIFVTFLVVMPSMYSMIVASFMATPKELIETGRVYGFNKFDEVTKIYLPLSLPVMTESLAGGFSLSFKILVAAEVLSSTAQGIGYLLTLANIHLETARLFAITAMAILVCITVELSLRVLTDKLAKDLY